MGTIKKGRGLDEVGRLCFCLQARMTARTVTRQYNSILAPIGLEVTEFSLLAALALGMDDSITGLAERLAFERTTLVRNLKGMETRGIIKPKEAAGRAVAYAPTARGEALLEKALPRWEKAQASVAERLQAESAGNLLSPASILASMRALRRATAAEAKFVANTSVKKTGKEGR
jgi:DNA-binding MarR family transcriptional regulator